MKLISLLLLYFLPVTGCFAQHDVHYLAATKAWQQAYRDNHEVVKKPDKKYFRFFPVDSNYRITCAFVKLNDSSGLIMKTSDNSSKKFYRFGMVNFTIHERSCRLYIYQSKDLMQNEKYRDYLFIPFTDATTGDESYGSGRYIDLHTGDIHHNMLELDFNKAYNPYCAYTTGYHCPIPPKENRLETAIRAGEMNFGKRH